METHTCTHQANNNQNNANEVLLILDKVKFEESLLEIRFSLVNNKMFTLLGRYEIVKSYVPHNITFYLYITSKYIKVKICMCTFLYICNIDSIQDTFKYLYHKTRS